MAELASSVVAVDVGGTAIKAAVTTHDGTELATATRPTPVADGPAAVIDAIVETVTGLREAVAGKATVEGVGLIPLGLVDPVAGVALFSANAGWRDVPIRDQVAERVGLPVAIDHDVRAAGLAESVSGAAQGIAEALFVSIGTGIAAAVITGGTVLSGASGMAGELGHIPVVPDGDRCACGQLGCLETYASAAAVTRRYRAASGHPQVTTEEVIALAGQGESAAVAVWNQALDALARALISYILICDPSLIVIGGGMANAGEDLIGPLSARVAAGLAFRSAPPIVVGAYGEHAGRVGAALIGWRAVGPVGPGR